ncbi:MAG: hypothetical protein RBR52_10955 [Thiomonas sp.]|uniref:hypothetical protein n=1 Tax=Thiomonas sp. TaxID=2047785 RepID=UPI002A36D43F|nr:hypothetical protein [Thiomonas sp.]MDY0331003.1 hypothetical protein [Thiomonas sp.]
MRAVWSLCAVVLALTTGLAGHFALAESAQPTPAQDAAQQAALQRQRAQVLAQYAQQRNACLQRFFVNDCLDAARENERAALAPIDAQLQAIALRSRMWAAEDEIRRVQANIAAAQRAQPDRAEAERQRAAREAELARRQQQAAQHAEQAAHPTNRQKVPAESAARGPQPADRPFPTPAPSSQLSPAQRAADAQRAQADFAARQKAYAEKQAEQARQNAAKPAAAPLPLPPPSAPLR